MTRAPAQKKCYRVRHSAIHGRGVFAATTIAKGTQIIEYRGERTTWEIVCERPASDPDDPALLINLGAAYARKGDAARAAGAFQAAIDSDTRYDLELADGTWVDSRQAARRALETLRNSAQFAALQD